MATDSDAPDETILTKVSGELDSAERAIEDQDLALAEMLLENAEGHLVAAGAAPIQKPSSRPAAPGDLARSSTSSAAAQVVGADAMARFDFLHLKFAHRTGRVQPAVALTQLVQLLQQKKDLVGGREFYTELSKAAYADRSSSLAHSHPPPPVKSRED